MKKLIQLALMVRGKYKIAACCLDKHGRILSYATNSYTKTHPTQSRCAKAVGKDAKEFLHAEIAALVRASRCKGSPYKIRVVRVNSQGELRMAKPCLICAEAIRLAGVKLVEYST